MFHHHLFTESCLCTPSKTAIDCHRRHQLTTTYQHHHKYLFLPSTYRTHERALGRSSRDAPRCNKPRRNDMTCTHLENANTAHIDPLCPPCSVAPSYRYHLPPILRANKHHQQTRLPIHFHLLLRIDMISAHCLGASLLYSCRHCTSFLSSPLGISILD